jgi:hypothetical protein
MGTEKEKQEKGDTLAQPSEAPLKNEPTPERAREEKAKQEEEACRK